MFEGPLDSPSKLADAFFPQGGLGGFQLRASTSTAYLKIRLIWCAPLGEQRKLPSLPVHHLAEPSSDKELPCLVCVRATEAK